MKIYTRTGDKGETGLFGGDRVSKSHPRVAAYGSLDELNSLLGMARASLGDDSSLRTFDAAIERAQGECFVVGALLATPANKLGALTAPFDRGLPADASIRLETEIDTWSADLEPLKTFILPGGSASGAVLHVARTVARRAEREVVDLNAMDEIPDGVIVYLNRLSTWLFVAARWVNKHQGRRETPWNGLPKPK